MNLIISFLESIKDTFFDVSCHMLLFIQRVSLDPGYLDPDQDPFSGNRSDLRSFFLKESKMNLKSF